MYCLRPIAMYYSFIPAVIEIPVLHCLQFKRNMFNIFIWSNKTSTFYACVAYLSIYIYKYVKVYKMEEILSIKKLLMLLKAKHSLYFSFINLNTSEWIEISNGLKLKNIISEKLTTIIPEYFFRNWQNIEGKCFCQEIT